MKTKLLKLVLIIELLQVLSNRVYSQTVIDYSAFSSTACNAFSSVINVNGIPHLTAIGQPTKASNGEAITLNSKVINNSDFRGTEYRVTYNFKKGYIYKIIVNAKRDPNVNSSGNVNLRFDLNNGGSGTSPSCNGSQPIDIALSGNLKNSQQIFVNDYRNYTFNYSTLSNSYSYLMVAAVPVGGVEQTIFIKQITIEETAPELILAPTALATTCGIATTQTFTVSNPSGLENITSYDWNLGSANNGWLYNGSPAPQTISTSNNSLSLTSVCNATTVNNVGVTIKVNNVNYKSYSSIVSRSTPNPVITGSSDFCIATPTYSINNLPCNATVTWSASGSYSITGSANANPVTLSYNGTGGGALTATVNTSCSASPMVITKTINPPVSYEILGPSSFCSSTSFQVFNLPLNSLINWTVTGDLSIDGASNNSMLYVNATIPNGSGTITANYTTPCGGTVVVSKDVLTTPAIINAKFLTGVIGQYGIPVFTGGNMYITVDRIPQAEFYEWTNGDTGVIIATTTEPYLLTTNYDYSCRISSIRVRAYTNCAGFTDPYELIYEGDCENYSMISFYPNPSDNELNVVFNNESKINNTNNSLKVLKEIKLIDEKGKVVKNYTQKDFTDNKLKIETKDLPSGTYYLHVKNDNRIEKKQIIIKH